MYNSKEAHWIDAFNVPILTTIIEMNYNNKEYA